MSCRLKTNGVRRMTNLGTDTGVPKEILIGSVFEKNRGQKFKSCLALLAHGRCGHGMAAFKPRGVLPKDGLRV